MMRQARPSGKLFVQLSEIVSYLKASPSRFTICYNISYHLGKCIYCKESPPHINLDFQRYVTMTLLQMLLFQLFNDTYIFCAADI